MWGGLGQEKSIYIANNLHVPSSPHFYFPSFFAQPCLHTFTSWTRRWFCRIYIGYPVDMACGTCQPAKRAWNHIKRNCAVIRSTSPSVASGGEDISKASILFFLKNIQVKSKRPYKLFTNESSIYSPDTAVRLIRATAVMRAGLDVQITRSMAKSTELCNITL